MNDTTATAQLMFADIVPGIRNNFITQFTFIANEINIIVFNLSKYGFTTSNYIKLYPIKNVEYVIEFT